MKIIVKSTPISRKNSTNLKKKPKNRIIVLKMSKNTSRRISKVPCINSIKRLFTASGAKLYWINSLISTSSSKDTSFSMDSFVTPRSPPLNKDYLSIIKENSCLFQFFSKKLNIYPLTRINNSSTITLSSTPLIKFSPTIWIFSLIPSSTFLNRLSKTGILIMLFKNKIKTLYCLYPLMNSSNLVNKINKIVHLINYINCNLSIFDF